MTLSRTCSRHDLPSQIECSEALVEARQIVGSITEERRKHRAKTWKAWLCDQWHCGGHGRGQVFKTCRNRDFPPTSMACRPD
eukprot:2160554-Karenia_brevis.AAC.1